MDMDTLIALVNSFIALIDQGLQYVVDWFYQDIYPFVTKTIAEWIKASVIAEIEMKIFLTAFAWDIAKDLLQSLNVSQYISAAWSALDPRLLQFLTFFRVPEGINLMLSALTTKFVYNYMGFGK